MMECEVVEEEKACTILTNPLLNAITTINLKIFSMNV